MIEFRLFNDDSFRLRDFYPQIDAYGKIIYIPDNHRNINFSEMYTVRDDMVVYYIIMDYIFEYCVNNRLPFNASYNAIVKNSNINPYEYVSIDINRIIDDRYTNDMIMRIIINGNLIWCGIEKRFTYDKYPFVHFRNFEHNSEIFSYTINIADFDGDSSHLADKLDRLRFAQDNLQQEFSDFEDFKR